MTSEQMTVSKQFVTDALHTLEKFSLDDRELGTVLAALRLYQRCVDTSTLAGVRWLVDIDAIATDGGQVDPLTSIEIDALCERLNQ